MISLSESILSSNNARMGDLVTDMLRKKPTPPASKYIGELNEIWAKLDKDFGGNYTWIWNYNDRYFLVTLDGYHAASVYPERGQAYIYLNDCPKKIADNIVKQLGWKKDPISRGNVIAYNI